MDELISRQNVIDALKEYEVVPISLANCMMKFGKERIPGIQDMTVMIMKNPNIR